MTSLQPDRLDNLDRPLQQAARSHRLRNAGRGVVAFGSILIIGQAILIAAIGAWRPEAISHLSEFALLGLFILLLASGGMIFMAAWIDRRERLIAEAEQRLPSLGRRLSTSMELRDRKAIHEAVPDTLRSAVYSDADAHLQASPWARFVDRRSAWTWAFTAFAVILLQGFFFLQSYSTHIHIAAPGNGNLSMQPASATNPLAGDNVDDKENKAEQEPRINATITITEPTEDGWATRIEAVLVEFSTDSEAGLTDLAVVVSHKGKTYHTAAFTTELAPGKQVGEAEFYLDEMPLEDYDVLAFHIEGWHSKPVGGENSSDENAGSTLVASDLKFLQIRPFNEDILFKPMVMGEGDPCLKILAWMIEEQRRLVRGGWLLQPTSGLPETSERYAMVGERVTEDQNELRGVMREARTLFVESPNTTPRMLTLLDQAGDAMDDANTDLSDAQYIDALAHQQQSLGHLVSVLREFEKEYGRFLDGLEVPEAPENADGPEPPKRKKKDLPEGKTYGDRQLMRDDLTAFDYELEEIAQQQAQLNWEQMQEEETRNKQWRKHEVPANPNDTGTPPEDKEKQGKEKEGEEKKSDKKEGKSNQGKKPAPSQGQAQASGQGQGQGQQGQQSQQAQSQDQSQQQAQSQNQQQAQQQDPSKKDSQDQAASQQDAAERQEALAERLDDLAKNAVTGESVRQALREAAEAMRDQAKQDADQQANGQPFNSPESQQPGQRAADLIDRALDERDRELHDAQLRQIENAMRQIAEGQTENAGQSGNAAALSPSEREQLAQQVEELAKAIEARRHGNGNAGPSTDGNLAERRASAAASLREAANTLRQMSAAGPEAADEQLGQAL
ncbi:MAG: hypothetical protein AAGA25_12085, partial [Planctomycetota bacterium]